MAVLKLNNVTTLTESGGALTLANAALGTPTSVTLTNATFPAGHVVQTTTPVRGATYTAITSSIGATVVTGSISPIYDDSSIIIFACLNVDVNTETTTSHGYGLQFKKTGTGVTTAIGSPVIGPLIQDEGYSIRFRGNFQYDRLIDTYTFVLMDNDCETTNTITYTLYGMTYAVDGNCNVGGNNYDNFQWSIYFQEIKR